MLVSTTEGCDGEQPHKNNAAMQTGTILFNGTSEVFLCYVLADRLETGKPAMDRMPYPPGSYTLLDGHPIYVAIWLVCCYGNAHESNHHTRL